MMNQAILLLVAGLFTAHVAYAYAEQDIDKNGSSGQPECQIWPNCTIEVRESTEYVWGNNKTGTRTVELTIEYPPPIKELDDCTKAGGIIRWDAKFEGSKVLPDLQEVIDSGAERLCVTIVHNVDAGTIHDYDIVQKNILSLLGHKDVQTERAQFAQYRTIWAAIPAHLLDDLVKSNYVANIDLYGKDLEIPWHITRGRESKIDPQIYEEIESKMKKCSLKYVDVGREYITIHDYDTIYCPLDKNIDGEEILNIYILLPEIPSYPYGWIDPHTIPTKEQKDKRRAEREIELAISQQPLVEFLESNNQPVIRKFESINAIRADITIDFLSQLEKRDDVTVIESSNKFYTLYGTTQNDQNNTGQFIPTHNETDTKFEISPNQIDVKLDGDDAAISVYMDIVPRSLPITDEVLGKNITLHINDGRVLDYEVLPGDGRSDTMLVLSNSEKSNSSEPNGAPLPSPKQQIADGTSPDMVQCREGLSLAIMKEKPVCLSELSIEKLAKRGLDIIHINSP